MLCPHFVLFPPGGGSDPDKVEDDAEDSGGKEKVDGEEDLEDYLNDPDFQNMSDSEGDDLPLFEVCPDQRSQSLPIFFGFITVPGTVLQLILALFLL
jgi:hypothetical protein